MYFCIYRGAARLTDPLKATFAFGIWVRDRHASRYLGYFFVEITVPFVTGIRMIDSELVLQPATSKRWKSVSSGPRVEVLPLCNLNIESKVNGLGTLDTLWILSLFLVEIIFKFETK